MTRPHPLPRRPRGPSGPRRQRGEIVLITLVFLLVGLLALAASLRDGVVNNLTTGNNLARQKSVQVADIALRQVESQILAAYGGMPLQVGAAGQVWWRDVAAGTAAPAASYWNACFGNGSTALRCDRFAVAANGTTLPYTAYAVVQPTGRSDSTSCGLAQYTAIYYDIHLHVTESGGATAVDTQTVYQLCTAS